MSKKIAFRALLAAILLCCTIFMLLQQKKEHTQQKDTQGETIAYQEGEEELLAFYGSEQQFTDRTDAIAHQVGTMGERIYYCDMGCGAQTVTVNSCTVTKEYKKEYADLAEIYGDEVFDLFLKYEVVAFEDGRISNDYSFVELSCTFEVYQEETYLGTNSLDLALYDSDYNNVANMQKEFDGNGDWTAYFKENPPWSTRGYLLPVEGMQSSISGSAAPPNELQRGTHTLRYVFLVSDEALEKGNLYCTSFQVADGIKKSDKKNTFFAIKLEGY